MSLKVSTSAKKFSYDRRILSVVLFGAAGFIIGCLLLFRIDFFYTIKKNDSIFHEVRYLPRENMLSFVGKVSDSLRLENQRREIIMSKKVPKAKVLPAELIAKMKDSVTKDQEILKQLVYYKVLSEGTHDIDTFGFVPLNKALHFSITPALVNKWDALLNKDMDFTLDVCSLNLGAVEFHIKDPKIPFNIPGKASFVLQRPATDIDFFTKYPAAGLWVMMILIYFSVSFVIILASIRQIGKIRALYSPPLVKPSIDKYVGDCFIVAIVFGGMLLLWNRTFYDEDIVKDLFLMKHLNTFLPCVIIIGSLAGIFCLAGMLYSSSLVKKSTPPVPPSPDPRKLTKLYNDFFLMAAILLSLMVFTTGALFSTINSMDFIKLLADDWGYSPVRTDFIYLYGALYSILLMFFYIPTRMRFRELDVDQPGEGVPGGNATIMDWIKTPFSKFNGALVAASPLLASMVQSLFDSIFNN